MSGGVLTQTVPVFPLPDVVLFPHAPLPLHVFELRYRAMVRDVVSSGERSLVIALLRPGWRRDAHGNPPVHAIGCLARLESVEWLVDDCFDLTVVGTSRVRIDRMVREYPYRVALARPLAEEPFSADDPLIGVEHQALITAVERLAHEEALQPELASALDPQIGFAALVNRVAMQLRIPAEQRQALLALDSVVRRGHRVRELLEFRLKHPPPPPGGQQN